MPDQATNLEHIRNPVRGDYWHEMFAPVCVVVSVSEDAVEVCEKFKHVEDHIEPDYAQTVSIPRAEFGLRFFYNSMRGKTWCDVSPARDN